MSELRDKIFYARAKRRLSKVTVYQVLAWADTSLWGVQQYLDGYRQAQDRAALEEARKGAVGLLAAIDNLLDRTPE